MSKDYVVYLVGDERTVNYNTQRLIATLDNLPILKEKYKNEFSKVSKNSHFCEKLAQNGMLHLLRL